MTMIPRLCMSFRFLTPLQITRLRTAGRYVRSHSKSYPNLDSGILQRHRGPPFNLIIVLGNQLTCPYVLATARIRAGLPSQCDHELPARRNDRPKTAERTL